MDAAVRLAEPAAPVEELPRAEDEIAPAGPLAHPVDGDLGLRFRADESSERDVPRGRSGPGEADEEPRVVSRAVQVTVCRDVRRGDGLRIPVERSSFTTQP